MNIVLTGTIANTRVVQLLNEIKSEATLSQIFKSTEFDSSLLKDCIDFTFRIMTNSFRIDCAQFNPHLNYLKMQPLLRVSLATVCQTLEYLVSRPEFSQTVEMPKLFSTNSKYRKIFNDTMAAVIQMLNDVEYLETTCLAYVDAPLVEKYFKENLLKPDNYKLFINFATACMQYANYMLTQNENMPITNDHDDNGNSIVHINTSDVDICFNCADAILKQKYLWIELNDVDKFQSNVELMLNVVHVTTRKLVANTNFINKYDNVNVSSNSIEFNNAVAEWHRQAVFVAKYVEMVNCSCDNYMSDESVTDSLNNNHARLQVNI